MAVIGPAPGDTISDAASVYPVRAGAWSHGYDLLALILF